MGHAATQDFTNPSADDLAAIRPARRRPWRWASGAGLAGLVLAVAGWVALGGGGADAWQTEVVTRGDLATRITAVGQLAAEDLVEVGSDLSGRLLTVNVEENQGVSVGDVLAQLDPEPFEHAVAQARAQMASAQASLAKSRVELEDAVVNRDRTERLVARDAASATELEAAELQVRTLQASVASAAAQRDQAAASLANAEDDLKRTTILSPIDGVVLQRFVEPGQTVVSAMSATALFEVASDLTALEVEVAVDEADVGRVAAGQRARFTVSAHPDHRFDAEVAKVALAPDPDATVVAYGTELRVDNREGLLRPGMTATAEIVVSELPDALQVPTLALRYAPEGMRATGDVVWVLRDGEVTGVPVEVLGTDGIFTAVSAEGLSEGDAVVVGGAK